MTRPFDEATDATRRTRLANERTYLAWWRSGMTALAVALGAGKLVPSVGHSPHEWAYQVLGAGFAALGCAFVVYALVRQRQVETALDRGQFAALDMRVVLGLTAATVALGVATIVLVLLGA